MELDASAVLWSAPERERAGRPLLVLLHGLGSHEGDLFSMSPALPLGPVIASVRAPLAYGQGWSWFAPRPGSPGDPDPQEVDAAAAAVLRWLDTLESTSVSLIGFSQGAALSLQLLRHAPDRFAATVALSGFIADGGHEGDARLAELRPPVFYGRGTEDPVIPTAAVDRTRQWLGAHATVTERIYEGLGHSISTAELGEFVGFLRAHG